MERVVLCKNNGKVIRLAQYKVEYGTLALISTLISYMILRAVNNNNLLPGGIAGIPYIVTIYAIIMLISYGINAFINKALFPEEIIIEGGKLTIRIFFTDFTLDTDEFIVDYSDRDTLMSAKRSFIVEDPAVLVLKGNDKELKLVAERDNLKDLIFEPKTIQ